MIGPNLLTEKQRRFTGVDALRGVAALLVCLDHFASGNTNFLPSTSLINTYCGWVGYHGIYVFFVISGFIIPLSLVRANYQIQSAPRYLLRRIVRIDPPYLASMLIEVTLNLILSRLPHYRGETLRWYEVLGHFGYLNGLLGWHWANIVYWTLAIEFQYYILISVTFPLIFSSSRFTSTVAILAWSVVGLMVPSYVLVFKYGPLFALGFILCRHLERRSVWLESILLSTVALGTAYHFFGWLCVTVALMTMLGIAQWKAPSNLWLFFGTISYSLYLIHGTVGGHFINGLVKFASITNPTPLVAWLVIISAFGVTLPLVWLFWRWVERPSHLLAQRISVGVGGSSQPVLATNA